MNKRVVPWLGGLLALLLVLTGCAPFGTPEAETGNGNGGDSTFEIPKQGARVTLPLHILAGVGEPGEEVTAVLRWEDGTELTETFTVMEGPDGEALLIGSMDWQTETRPPQPGTQSATLTVQSQSETPLAEQSVTVVGADDPDTRLVDLYWTMPGIDRLESEQRRVLDGENIEARTLRELLWGPPPRNLAGFETAIPTPEEVLAYPGRDDDWGARVELLGLTIEDGVATADFSQEMRAYGGGSARVQTIREQITHTLEQFPTVDEVRIAVEGETEGVLQP